MNRRRFMFWCSFGAFSLSERLGLSGLDRFAAAAMRVTDPKVTPEPVASSSVASSPPEHWTVAEDKTWRWLERENRIDGEWVLTGTTTPINKETGERKSDIGGYLVDSLVPKEMRQENQGQSSHLSSDSDAEPQHHPQLPDATCRGRHGRPPSEWLRSLRADELRIWLKTIKVPEADVSGMTYWEHITRDHLFDPDKISGLIEAEQAKLHAAAHFGY